LWLPKIRCTAVFFVGYDLANVLKGSVRDVLDVD